MMWALWWALFGVFAALIVASVVREAWWWWNG